MQRHVIRVKLYKIILGGLILALGSTLLFWHGKDKLKITHAIPPKNLIKNLRFFSETVNERELFIEVEKANIRSETEVLMSNLSATITVNPLQKIHMFSPNGVFNQKDKSLWLKNGVNINHDNGMKIYTFSANYEANSDQLTGNDGIKACYKNITLEANNFTVKNSLIKVEGRARLLIKGN